MRFEQIRLSLAAALLAAAVQMPATAQQKPTDASPATQAATKPAVLTVEGTLRAVDPYELKLKMEAFGGALKVVKAAAPFSTVKAGDLLLELDKTDIQRALTEAKGALAAAQVGLTKAESDAKIGADSDALAMRQQEDAVKMATENVKYWDSIDGPQMLKQWDLTLKQWQDNVGDQEDELDQLKKMYKDEDLTNATKDIVLKRAIRRLEQTKIRQEMETQRVQRSREQNYDRSRQRVLDALEEAKNALASLQVKQKQSAVSRENAVASARIALDQAKQKLDDLMGDEKLFSVKSPVEGMVVYGTVTENGWQGGDAKALRPDQKVAAGGVVMRVITPGKLNVQVTIKAADGFVLKEGTPATVTVEALPGVSYEGTCTSPLIEPKGSPASPTFVSTVKLPELDHRLLPGMKATVKIQGLK